LGKVPATYRARLSTLISLCLEIETEYGYVDARLLAKKAGLTDRAVRDYINDLLSLGILVYAGGGRYRVNRDLVESVLRLYYTEPSVQLRIEDFITPSFVQSILRTKELDDKVRRVLGKLNLELIFSGTLRDKIRDLRIREGEYGPLVGDRVVMRGVARDVVLDDVWVPGSFSAKHLAHYGLGYYALISIVYLSAGVYIGYFEKNVLNDHKSIKRVVPELIPFEERQPFVPGDPFYEISTDFPELLDAGRRLAARLLKEILHYHLDLRMLKEYGDMFDVYFRSGTLVPHGFFVQAKKLVQLKDECHDLFYRLVDLGRKKGVIVAGITPFSVDNILLRTVEEMLNTKIADTNDINFLMNVLENGDTTCLIKREREKGKPQIEGYYEFYIKCRDFVVRVDFVSHEDPWAEYEKLRDLVYSTFVTPPRPGMYPGPGVVNGAQELAYRNLEQLMRMIEGSLKVSLYEYVEGLLEKRDEERMRRVGRSGA